MRFISWPGGGNRYFFNIQSEIGAPVEDPREIPNAKKKAKGLVGEINNSKGSQKDIKGSDIKDKGTQRKAKRKRKKRQINKENSIIRANFQLQRNRKPTPQVLFDIRKGKKKSEFELTVQAGSSLGKVNLSFHKRSSKL